MAKRIADIGLPMNAIKEELFRKATPPGKRKSKRRALTDLKKPDALEVSSEDSNSVESFDLDMPLPKHTEMKKGIARSSTRLLNVRN